MKTINRSKASALIATATLGVLAATAIAATASAEGPMLRRVPVERVCMMNNQDMGKDQIPVPVGDKMYYGCCAGCVKALTENANDIRYAKDPVSGARVDKATAVIGALPDNRAFYFESEETFDRFAEQLEQGHHHEHQNQHPLATDLHE